MESSNSSESKLRHHPHRYQFGKIFWGLLLVLIGTVLLLDNFNVIDADLSNAWRLWPLLIVAAGASMLSMRSWIGALLAAILGVCILALVLGVTLGWIQIGKDSTAKTMIAEISKSSDQVKEANVLISGGAGRIGMESDPVTSLVYAKLDSSYTKLSQKSSTVGHKQDAAISMDAGERWWHGNYKNDLRITLAETLPINLTIDAGASDIYGDLSHVQLQQLTIKSGASSINFRLGAKTNTTDVNINIGASSLTLLVPKNSGVSMRIESGLSSSSTAGLHKVSDGYYESENFPAADKKITIHGKIGISNLDIQYY